MTHGVSGRRTARRADTGAGADRALRRDAAGVGPAATSADVADACVDTVLARIHSTILPEPESSRWDGTPVRPSRRRGRRRAGNACRPPRCRTPPAGTPTP